MNVKISNRHDFNEHINMAIKFYATTNKNTNPQRHSFLLKQKVKMVPLMEKPMTLIQHEDTCI